MKTPDGNTREMQEIPHVYVEYGRSGHEKEYVITVQPNVYTEAQDIPSGWEQQLSELLGKEWHVLDRGFRIEVLPPELIRSDETDAKVRDALRSIVGTAYEFKEVNN